nr:FtsX-like permease family protein [uncultured Mucilaginibacter sp.]
MTAFLVYFFSATQYFNTSKTNVDIEDLMVIEAWNIANDTIRQNLEAISEVKEVSLSDLTPYRRLQFRQGDTLQYGGHTARIWTNLHADEKLAGTLGLTMQSGRWFRAEDRGAIKTPVVIDEKVKDLLFPGMEAVGRTIKYGSGERQVIGVVKNLNDYGSAQDVFNLDTGASYLIKLKQPINNVIYKKLKNALSGFQSEFIENVTPVKQYKQDAAAQTNSVAIVMGFLSGFLIINTVLGLFSILYQNINRRRQEIGLRRATGAVAGEIYWQVILEVIMLATIAIVPGIIVAWQFAIFEAFGSASFYYSSMLIGAIVIYLLVILCALYPARLASKIQPAAALHEE